MTNIKKKITKEILPWTACCDGKDVKKSKTISPSFAMKSYDKYKKYKKTLPRFITTMAIKKIKKGLKG